MGYNALYLLQMMNILSTEYVHNKWGVPIHRKHRMMLLYYKHFLLSI